MDNRLKKIAKQIINEEFSPIPAIRAAKRLYNFGIYEEDILKLDMNDVIRVDVANALREIEREQ